MSIFLDETQKEDEYLIKALEMSNIPPWIKKSLINKVLADQKRKQEIKECNHVFSKYTGKKECCAKCHAFGQNMGEEWIIEGLESE